ncbi:MAG: HipA domain-containing protein [Youngiibacter sp.]|nr:HipA domain-containing protein [Youngiibacter sp.]
MDFSNYPLSNKYYGGSEKKIGIIIDNSEFMLKFQKKTAFGVRFNHISEYIGSHIFQMLGIASQETSLGTYLNEPVVACKDFNVLGKQFVPFNELGESTLDQNKETYQYEYEDIMKMLRDNSKLTNVTETIAAFWELYIVDALIGNFERHGSNWGFIKENNSYLLAPIFDNGSCLFPNIVDEDEMNRIINSVEETEKRVFTFPTSQIRLNGRKSSYYEVISSLEFTECNFALKSVFTRINMDKIRSLVDETPYITRIRKDFYKHMLESRYRIIIKDSYEKLIRSEK